MDADISAYLDFEIERRFDEPLTLRHLLTHSAGFEERWKVVPTTDLEAYVKNDPPAQVFAPGTTPAYSNYGMALAGYIVQRVSGQPFETYVREHVLEPAGMTSSTYEQPCPRIWPTCWAPAIRPRVRRFPSSSWVTSRPVR